MDSLTHKIHIKGYVPRMFFDSSILRKFSDIDIELGYSTIMFKGTETQLNDFCKECSKDETYFKIIGVD